jgi:hypothetical protein
MPNILQTHPSTHRNKCKIYFIECTIKLQPEYQHLAKQFSPIIKLTHPKHQDTITAYPYLSRYIYRNQHHPPPHILYALITTISPIIETCNHLLIQTPARLDNNSLRTYGLTPKPTRKTHHNPAPIHKNFTNKSRPH